MNEGLAWGLAVLIWIAVVALSGLHIVHFYGSSKNRVEQVTVLHQVSAPPEKSAKPAIEAESRPRKDQSSLPSTPSASYRSMLMEKDKEDDQLK